MSIECKQRGRWVKGCKFEARYTQRGPSIDHLQRVGVIVDIMSEEQLYALGTEEYVCDVCVRCGAVVK